MYGETQYAEVQYGSVGGNYAAYTSTFNETVAPTDSVIKAVTRRLSETGTITEVFFDFVYGKGLAFMDTITDSEVIARSITRINSDISNLTEIYSRSYGRLISFTDSFLGLTDSITHVFSRFVTFVETATLEELFSRSAGRTIVFSEIVTLTELFNTVKGYCLILLDTISGLIDTITRSITRIFIDIPVLTDKIRRYYNGLLVNLWTIVGKTSSSFSKVVKPSAPTYTKELKPNIQDIWTPEEKPY